MRIVFEMLPVVDDGSVGVVNGCVPVDPTASSSLVKSPVQSSPSYKRGPSLSYSMRGVLPFSSVGV